MVINIVLHYMSNAVDFEPLLRANIHSHYIILHLFLIFPLTMSAQLRAACPFPLYRQRDIIRNRKCLTNHFCIPHHYLTFSAAMLVYPTSPPHTSNLVSHSPKASKTSLLRLGWQCFVFFFFFSVTRIRRSLHFQTASVGCAGNKQSAFIIYFSPLLSLAVILAIRRYPTNPPPHTVPPQPPPRQSSSRIITNSKKYFLKCSERLGAD